MKQITRNIIGSMIICTVSLVFTQFASSQNKDSKRNIDTRNIYESYKDTNIDKLINQQHTISNEQYYSLLNRMLDQKKIFMIHP